jgi:CheY-like chemotaxis protein
MTDELFTLRVILVSSAPEDQELFRRAASVSKVPIDVIIAADVASASGTIGAGVDVVFVDNALGDAAITQLHAAARGAAKPPFTVLLSDQGATARFPTDALANKPSGVEAARRLIEGAVRARMPSRVLILDDSATMRSIVRRILSAARFPLELSEAEQGSEAIELARKTDFDIVFVDYNLPGFTGLETMAEFKRERRNATFVLITSTQDETVAVRARAQGAAFLKKPFYLADVEAILCSIFGLRALNQQRA